MADKNKGMTFDKYIDNPSGGSAFTNRNMYKDMYKKRFDAVLLREQGNIKYELYTANDSIDSHYVYLKIPSEVVPNFYYDVVIHLFTKNNSYKNEANLRRYSVEFYTNDPAFVYTFAHSFAKNGLFIKDLEPKMSKQALRNKAIVRNPKDDVWYVKSLYFAYLTMEKYNLFAKSIFSAKSKKYNKNDLLKLVTDADKKVLARQIEDKKVAKEKAKKREEERKLKEKNSKKSTEHMTKTSNSIRRTKVTSTVKSTKTTKVSKFTSKK